MANIKNLEIKRLTLITHDSNTSFSWVITEGEKGELKIECKDHAVAIITSGNGKITLRSIL